MYPVSILIRKYSEIVRNLMIILLKKILLYMLNKLVRKSHLITYALFRINVNAFERIHWDFTTIVLKKALNKYVCSENRVLEIGAGPYSILSIYLFKKFKLNIIASDINPDYVANSILICKKNGIHFEIIQSDLFSNINTKFDVIFFNSVYIPKKSGLALGIDKLHCNSSDWCGGETGTEVIERYLESSRRFINPFGKILLGFNFKYLEEKKIENMCKNNNLSIKNKVYMPFNPSVVYVITKNLEET